MKVTGLVAIALIVALVGAAVEKEFRNERNENNAKRAYGYFEIPWAIPDFIVGLAMGTYGGINSRVRDGDCFSKWYDWGLAAIELSNYFTKPFDAKDW